MNEDETRELSRHIDAITGYLPLFERPGDAIGRWTGGQRDASGDTRGRGSNSAESLAFMRACPRNGWVERFEWRQWGEGEAVRYVDEPSRLDQAPCTN